MKNLTVLLTFMLSLGGLAATLEATAAETIRVEQAFLLPVPDAGSVEEGLDAKKKKKKDRRKGEESEEELRLARCSRSEAQKTRGM